VPGKLVAGRGHTICIALQEGPSPPWAALESKPPVGFQPAVMLLGRSEGPRCGRDSQLLVSFGQADVGQLGNGETMSCVVPTEFSLPKHEEACNSRFCYACVVETSSIAGHFVLLYSEFTIRRGVSRRLASVESGNPERLGSPNNIGWSTGGLYSRGVRPQRRRNLGRRTLPLGYTFS